MTGESVPVQKIVGSTVSGGSINIGNTQLVIRTTTSVDDSAVSRLIRLVEEAQANTSPTEMMIDSFARAYTPTVVGMAALMERVQSLADTVTRLRMDGTSIFNTPLVKRASCLLVNIYQRSQTYL